MGWRFEGRDLILYWYRCEARLLVDRLIRLHIDRRASSEHTHFGDARLFRQAHGHHGECPRAYT